jgi:hypothetical protein
VGVWAYHLEPIEAGEVLIITRVLEKNKMRTDSNSYLAAGFFDHGNEDLDSLTALG